MKRIGCHQEKERGSNTMYKKVHNSCRTRKKYHAKLLLYYPWNNEDDIISPFTTYHKSYISKQIYNTSECKKIQGRLCGI